MNVRPGEDWPKGKVVRIAHQSPVLQSNPWGDPYKRHLNVYLPAGYSEADDPYVSLWDFAAFTNSGPGHLNWKGHGENLPQRLDRLIATEAMPPVVVPMPDCYTSLGGNQYVNSTAVGQYADYIVKELVPLLSEHINIIDSRHGRAAFGKSSGGYGALVHAMYFPETWGAIASHAGDIGFDWVYRSGFPATAAMLSSLDGDTKRFLRNFWRKKNPGNPDYATLMTLAMAASYDPSPDPLNSIDLPFDLHTLKLDERRWQCWLEHDPLNLLDQYAASLSSLELLYLDVGSRDQYLIQYGTRDFVQRLKEKGIAHEYEEFDGTHSGIDWRLDISLPKLALALYNSRESRT
jgi:enterochelin esterase-like enzyme